MESLEDYALYLASVRLAPDRTSFEMHAARYKPPRSLSPSSSMSGGSSSIPAGSRLGGLTSGGSTFSGSRRHVTFGGSRVHDSSMDHSYSGTMRSGSSGTSTDDSWTSSTRQLAFPYRELSVKLQPHEATEKYRSKGSAHSGRRSTSSRRRKDSIDNYRTPGLAELYVDPDWF
uniref:Expressed protein n=2 Tax=Schizophyllum commune (strain H4-8 / FGSC 9210) TaxID=578458 RepID=D8PTV2_SCHCM